MCVYFLFNIIRHNVANGIWYECGASNKNPSTEHKFDTVLPDQLLCHIYPMHLFVLLLYMYSG